MHLDSRFFKTIVYEVAILVERGHALPAAVLARGHPMVAPVGDDAVQVLRWHLNFEDAKS